MSLPAYEPAIDQSPPGHLTAVELPDGSAVQYRYDHRQNLVSVLYPREDQSSAGYHYRYDDEIDSSLLTERTNSYGKILARWTYDDTGRVISYRKGMYIRPDGSEAGAPNLTLSYAGGVTAEHGITVVTDRNGNRSEYQWKLDGNRRVLEVARQVAEPIKSQHQASQDQVVQSGESLPSQSEEHVAPEYAADVLTIMALDELGYPNQVQYQPASESEPDQLAVRYSQAGELLDVSWESGVIHFVNSDRRITRQEYSLFVKSNWEAGTNMPAVINAIAQRGYIESTTKRFLNRSTKALTEGAIIRGSDLGESWSSGAVGNSIQQRALRSRAAGPPYSAPCADPLRDCSELLKAQEYAEVADCAYVSSLCSTRLVEADLNLLGVDWSDLVDRSFRSGIYYDREKNEYIVSFAGTTFTSIGDWVTNAQQEFGKHAAQYELAVDLARLLTRNNPDLTFKFTGHSLGGGLATAAAAATGRDAIVFNPAALNPQTAINYSFNYANANLTTEVYSVDEELLSQVQNGIEFASKVQGNIHTLPRPSFSWVQANVGQNPLWAYNSRLGLTLHGMDAVKQSLSELIQRYQCA